MIVCIKRYVRVKQGERPPHSGWAAQGVGLQCSDIRSDLRSFDRCRHSMFRIWRKPFVQEGNAHMSQVDETEIKGFIEAWA